MTKLRRSVFASAWVSDTQRISINELLIEDQDIVIDHDDENPPPKKIADPTRQDSQSNTDGERHASPSMPPVIPTLSVSDYQPASPPPSQLDLPENERPPSWPHASTETVKRHRLSAPPHPSVSPVLSSTSRLLQPPSSQLSRFPRPLLSSH